MALDLSPPGLAEELKKARENTRQFVNETFREQIRRYRGPAWKEGDQPGQVDFENHAYAWLSVFLPILASGNPTVRGRTPRLGSAAAFAKAIELAVNRNFALTDIKRTIEQLATDWAFKYCVALTMPMPVKGMMEREDPPFRPTTKRLSLEDYVWDPLSPQHAECRYQGHRIIRDKDSLVAESEDFPERGWDRAAIESLREDRARAAKREKLEQTLTRNEVEFWEIWVPEHQLKSVNTSRGPFQPTPEDGFVGTIFTVAEEASEFVRAPRPFWGPRDGPYTYSGYLYVPDEVAPLSPIGATVAQAEELNAVMSASIASIRSYKRGFAVNSTAADLHEKIANFMDLGVFSVEALEKLQDNLKELEIGGLTQQHMMMLELLRFVLERGSGITDQQQGATTGSTATEASIANQATGARKGYMTEKFVQYVVKPIAHKEAWYLANDPRSKTPLGEQGEGLFVDTVTGQPLEYPVLEGGPEHVQMLEEMDIEIQPISMRYTSELLEAERQASWEQFLLATAPMIPQLPYLDWGQIYAQKAESLGNPSLAKVVDVQKAMFLGMLQFQMNLGQVGQPMSPTTTPPQGRLGVDVRQQQRPQLKAAERPQGFSANARPQVRKAPREAGATSSTH